MAYPKSFTVQLTDHVERDTAQAYLVRGVWYPKSQCQWRYVGCGRNMLFCTQWIADKKAHEVQVAEAKRWVVGILEDAEKVIDRTKAPRNTSGMITPRGYWSKYRAEDIQNLQAFYGEYLKARDQICG